MRRTMRVYVCYSEDDDNMSARMYQVQRNGSVLRWCYPRACRVSVRQSISRVQAARELAVLRGSRLIQRRVFRYAA